MPLLIANSHAINYPRPKAGFPADYQNSTDPDYSTTLPTRKQRQTSNFRSDLGPYDRKTSPEIVRYAPIRTKNAWHTNLEPVLGLHRSAQTHVVK